MEGLFGRDAELVRVGGLVADAARGSGGALLLLGDAGIGKTSLLDAAAERARTEGMAVLRARAVVAERELPFAGLTELLAPADALVDGSAPAQAAALAAARGGAGEAAARDAAPREPFAAAVALLRVLEAIAAGHPAGVAVLVDDAQWLDAVSLDALFFAARRVASEPVAVVVAARPEPDRGLGARGVETLELAGLGPDEARRLLGDELASAPLRVVLESAGGNPLALVELARALTPEQRSGSVAVSAPVRPGAAIQRSFRSELDALPAPVSRALLVPAADEGTTLERLHAVLADLGLAPGALDDAERAGVLIGEHGRVRFRHPLLRSVVYHAAPLADRVAVHSALAGRLGASGREGIRRAWHLAAAATGPDEQAAAALEAAALDAWGRGAAAEAADAFARAAELTPPQRRDAAAARILPAARLLAATDQPRRALALAERALETPPDDVELRAALQHLRGTITMRTGALDAGCLILVEQAALAAAQAPVRAGQMLLDANLRNRVVGDYPEMVRLARRTRELAAGADAQLAALGELTEAVALVNEGDGATAAATIARHEAVLLDPAALRFGVEVLAQPAHAAIWLEQFDSAERILSTLIARARERSAISALVYPLATRAQLALRRGRLRPAHADADEAVRLAAETRQHGLAGFATAILAEVEATLGRADECREHAATTIAICDAIGGDAMGMWGRNALGLLQLSLGRPEEGIAPLEACARLADRIGMREPNTVQWAANLVEALVRSGREDEAREQLPRLEAGCGTAWAAAALLRCRGLLTAGDDGEALLARSVDAFEAAGAQFEAARSRLALGERQRRSRGRRRSREPLTAALTAFEAAGAAPWAARAQAELRAGGHASGAPRAEAWDELTPHELRISLLVAEGRTNREIATQLLVTRKTVEHHLTHVYRKLGLRSRTELARELAGESA